MLDPPRSRPHDATPPAVTSRLLAGNAALAATALIALFVALLGGDSERNALLLVIGGLAFAPLLWVFTTSAAALRGAQTDARTLLERQAILVIFAVITLTLARVAWLFGTRIDHADWYHYLIGGQTLLVYYSARLHAATRRPPQARLHPTATAGIVASIAIELGVIVRLLSLVPGG